MTVNDTNKLRYGGENMSRRDVSKIIGGAILGSAMAGGESASAQQSNTNNPVAPSYSKLTVAMLAFPNMTPLDLVAPHMAFAGLMNTDIHIVWKEPGIIKGEPQLSVLADTSFADCPKDIDVLFVPGGLDGVWELLNDNEVLDFISDRASRAKFITSVCTGALILGSAGLLQGYKATTYWAFKDLLPKFGAIPVNERVVIDRNRITGGGITAGLDFGLEIIRRLRSDDFAKVAQLAIEYDPHPPFHSGSPETAEPQTLAIARQMIAPQLSAATTAVNIAQKRMTTK
jgi:cyclohexyl-isocyanide hydratase